MDIIEDSDKNVEKNEEPAQITNEEDHSERNIEIEEK